MIQTSTKMQISLNTCFMLIHCLSIVNSLVCYDCFSSSGGFCGKRFRTNKVSRAVCLSAETMCYVERDDYLGITVVKRNCGFPTHCANKTNCTTCASFLCNSGYRTASKVGLTFTALFVPIVLYTCLT